MNTASEIVKTLELVPHPEGGFFKETYRGREVSEAGRHGSLGEKKRVWATGIYYLLTAGSFSAFHRLRDDELWHFYDGTPIVIHMITPSGHYSNRIVGSDIKNGQVPQLLIPGGTWFAAELSGPGEYALSGCTVSPGFDYSGFELARRDKLIAEFPHHRPIIGRLTRA